MHFSIDKKIVKNTYENFKYNSKSVIYFEILYKLLTMFIIMPVISLLLKKSMSDMGVNSLGNTDIIKYGLTPDGMACIVIVLAISFIAMFIEIGILTYMAYSSHKKRHESLLEGMINIMSICPNYPSVYMLYIVLISGVAGPLTGIGLYNSLITKLSVPSFVKVELFKTIFGKILYVLGIAVLIILIFRWILAIPIMVIEDVTLKEAFKKSRDIHAKNKKKIFTALLIWMIINYAMRFMLLGIVMGTSALGLYIFETNSIISFMMMTGGIIVFFIVYIFVSVVTLPMFISYLVELYYSLREYDATERIFVDISFYKDKKAYKWLMNYSKEIITVVIGIFIIVSSGYGISAVFNNVVDKEVEVSAHRGSSEKAPENSISSIKAAIKDNADYAEIDIRLTKDGEVVVFHDGSLKRVDGTGRSIKNMTIDEVRSVDLGSSFSNEFKGEKIPLFSEVLEEAKGKIKLNVELKTSGDAEELSQKAVELINDYDMSDQVIISSQDYDALQMVKQQEPLIPVGYILTFGIGDFTKLNVDFISMDYEMLTKSRVYGLHALDKKVHVWTINDADKAENAIKLGADNIITDSPDMVRRVDEDIRYHGEVNYMTRFFDSVYAIMKYVNI